MNITAYFTDNGVPRKDLSPKIDIWKIDKTRVADSQLMTEIDGGFYFYNFATYDPDEVYVVRADGGHTLSDSERYMFSGNESYKEEIINGVWDEQVAAHLSVGSFGEFIKKKLLTVAKFVGLK